MPPNLKFELPDGWGQRQLIELLAPRFRLRPEAAVSETRAYCDTFDWRLFNASLVLVMSPGRVVLRGLTDGELVDAADVGAEPTFARDLPPSGLRERLEPILDVRALMRLAEIDAVGTRIRVLNRDEKTVARLVYEELTWPGSEGAERSAAQALLEPVRGYENFARELTETLEQGGLRLGADDLYFRTLEAVGRRPGDYSSRMSVQLGAGMRADDATRSILRALLEVIRRNEAGVKQDIDTEFLHDFRVAIRRTRSALGQVKRVFPEEVTARFKGEFSYLGRATNQLRDLDVYLLNSEQYRAMLPASLRLDVDPLFQHLRRQRSAALAQVIQVLSSARYAEILRAWEAFLAAPSTAPGPVAAATGSAGPGSPAPVPAAGSAPPAPGGPPEVAADSTAPAPNASLPILELARARIRSRYRAVVEAGSRITEDAADEMLHRLRIDCKKLRYLLEFFAGLFPPKQIGQLIKQLKGVQDNLGRFQDLCVHELQLQGFVGELPLADEGARRTHMAVGSLVGTLDREKREERGRFAPTFSHFASASNRALFDQLLSADSQEVSP